MAEAATTGTGGPASSRFAAACGALSQYVRAADRRMHHGRPAPAVRPLALMPGADVVPDGREEHEQEQKAGPASGARQLAIFYGGRVLVLDECPADKAAALLRLAAGAAAGRGEEAGGELAAATDLPMARKASLQRFMEKRKGRLTARADPYRRAGGDKQRDHLTLAL